MPELPDVEVYRRRLWTATRRRTLQGAHVVDGQVLAGTSAGALDRGLRGARVADTHRHGKTL
jgi:formamidopyrimidine-DNA glycosylase